MLLKFAGFSLLRLLQTDEKEKQELQTACKGVCAEVLENCYFLCFEQGESYSK